MLTSLIDQLDRRWDYLSSLKWPQFGLHLIDFIDSSLRDPLLTQILIEWAAVYEATLSKWKSNEEQTITALKGIRIELAALVPQIVELVTDVAEPAFQSSATKFDQICAEAVAMPAAGKAPSYNRPARLEKIIENWYRKIDEQDVSTPAIEELARRLQALAATWDHATRAYSLFAGTSAPCAWMRLRTALRILNPDPTRALSAMEFAIEVASSNLDNLRMRLWGRVPDATVTQEMIDIQSDAKLVYERLRESVGETLSLLATIRRFKQRCEWYDANRLRTIAVENSGTGEDLLTEQAAIYLFDQGVDPLLKPMMGRLQPDLIGLGRWPLYIESKLAKASTSRSYLKRGLFQMWSTLGRIRTNGLRIREAFYIVFRLDGPLYILPETLHGEGITIYPTLIDLGLGETSGARQSDPPRQISAAEVGPESEADQADDQEC